MTRSLRAGNSLPVFPPSRVIRWFCCPHEAQARATISCFITQTTFFFFMRIMDAWRQTPFVWVLREVVAVSMVLWY
jgi:hypothetical protein